MVVIKFVLLALFFLTPISAFAQGKGSLNLDTLVQPAALKVTNAPAFASADPMRAIFQAQFVRKVAGFLAGPPRPTRLNPGGYSLYANFTF